MRHTLLLLLFIPLITAAQPVKIHGGKAPVELRRNGSGVSIIQSGDTTDTRNIRSAIQRLWIETLDLHKGFYITYQNKVILRCSMSGECYTISKWEGKPEVGLMSQFLVAILVENHLQELYDAGKIFHRN